MTDTYNLDVSSLLKKNNPLIFETSSNDFERKRLEMIYWKKKKLEEKLSYFPAQIFNVFVFLVTNYAEICCSFAAGLSLFFPLQL